MPTDEHMRKTVNTVWNITHPQKYGILLLTGDFTESKISWIQEGNYCSISLVTGCLKGELNLEMTSEMGKGYEEWKQEEVR